MVETHEMHGILATAYPGREPCWVRAWDEGKGIALTTTRTDPCLTPAQARYLARKLYRLARILEARNT